MLLLFKIIKTTYDFINILNSKRIKSIGNFKVVTYMYILFSNKLSIYFIILFLI